MQHHRLGTHRVYMRPGKPTLNEHVESIVRRSYNVEFHADILQVIHLNAGRKQAETEPLPREDANGRRRLHDDKGRWQGTRKGPSSEEVTTQEVDLIGPIAYDTSPITDPTPELWDSIVRSCTSTGMAGWLTFISL